MSGMFKKIVTTAFELNQVQENVDRALRPILRSPLLFGVLMRGQLLASASVTRVQHGLGRVPLGWVVVGKNANATIWESTSDNSFRERSLQLECSTDVTASIWVF